MLRLKAGLVGLLCLVAVAGCTTNNSIAPVSFTPTGGVVLQLSVGTLSDAFGVLENCDSAGQITGGSTHVNAVTTFRSSSGFSAFVNPGTATLTPPTGSPVRTAGNLFAYGRGVFTNCVAGLPPAYPGVTVGPFPTGWLVRSSSTSGITGVRLFDSPQFSNTLPYTVATTVSQNGIVTLYSATALLPTTTPTLGNPAASIVWTNDIADDGGGTITLSANNPVVTKISERLVVITDLNNGTSPGDGPGSEIATGLALGTATVVTFPPGTLAPLDLVNFPNATRYEAFVIGADYPLFEAGPPNSLSPTPTLFTNATNTSDLTVSDLSSLFNR